MTAPPVSDVGAVKFWIVDGMISPQQFLECFLKEKTAALAEVRPLLTAVYGKYFGEPLSRHAEQFMPRDKVRAVVEDVKQSDGVASAVTREHFRMGDLRTRYRLAASGESWKIIGIDRECFMCCGTGQSNRAPCSRCKGEGWCEADRDATGTAPKPKPATPSAAT